MIGTLRLAAATPGESTVEVTGAGSDSVGIQLGSCEPAFEVEMTCAGGTIAVTSGQ